MKLTIKSLRKVSLILIVTILLFNLSNYNSIVAKDSILIDSFFMDHTPLIDGDTENFYVTSSGTEQVQYRLFMYIYAESKWVEMTSGYTPIVYSNIPYKINTSKIFNTGKYCFSVWVRKAGSSSDYDSYKLFDDFNCQPNKTSSSGDLNLKEQYSVGEKIIINNISNLNPKLGVYEYKLNVYDYKADKWLQIGNYADTVQWIPQRSGKYLIDVWVKNKESKEEYEAIKLKQIYVSGPDVVSAEKITVVSNVNQKPNLPLEINANFSDGTKNKVNITWSPISANMISNVGEYDILGKIDYTDIVVQAHIINMPNTNGNISINTFCVDQNPFIPGNFPTFSIFTYSTKRLQYKISAYNYDDKSWNICSDYSMLYDINQPVEIKSNYKLKSGNYAFYLWVRSEGSTNDYDTYKVIDNIQCYNYLDLSGDIQGVKDNYSLGETININSISSLESTNNYLYKLYVYDYALDKWESATEYGEKIQWLPSKEGKYLLDIWVKSKNSDKEYEGIKLKPIYIGSKVEKFNNKNAVLTYSYFDQQPAISNTDFTLYLFSKCSEKVKYIVWGYDYSTRKWEDYSGYSPEVDGSIGYKLKLNRKLKSGTYAFSIQVKSVKSLVPYDSYKFIDNIQVVDKSISLTNSINNIKPIISFGETININLNDDKNKYKYKLYYFDYNLNKWFLNNEYSDSVSWTPSHTGKFLLNLWIKNIDSNKEYNSIELKIVDVHETISNLNAEPINLLTYLGKQIVLPQSTLVTKNNGSTSYENIIWDDGNNRTFNDIGNFSASGTVEGTNLRTVCNINCISGDSKIKQASLDHGPLIVGESASVLVSSNCDNKVQYRIYGYDYATQKWSLYSDYTDPVESDKLTPINLNKVFSTGKYAFSVQVKKAGSINDYDSYYLLDNVNCVGKKINVNSDMDIQSDTFKVGESVFVNGVKNITGETGTYQYKLFVKDYADNSWHLISEYGLQKIEWIPKHEGTYLLDLWIKASNSNNEYDSVKLQKVVVTKSNENYSYTDYANSLNQAIDLQMAKGTPVYQDTTTWNWVPADRDKVFSFLNPLNFLNSDYGKYQFLKLNFYDGISSSDLNNILYNKGVLNGKADTFIYAGQKNNVNPIYLAAHSMLETGNGTSKLATGILVSSVDGVAVEPKIVYNMYGVGAYDSDANKYGSEYAYKQGWFTVKDAIVGGAYFIGKGYINNTNYKQDTLYKMRWNPNNPATHQYATDVRWAYNQVINIKRLYDLCNSPIKYFDIPVYKGY